MHAHVHTHTRAVFECSLCSWITINDTSEVFVSSYKEHTKEYGFSIKIVYCFMFGIEGLWSGTGSFEDGF